MTSVSRRTFLGTAAAASVSAVAAPAMAASTSGNNLPAKWDDTVDVVVLGCGGAGMMLPARHTMPAVKLPFMTQASLPSIQLPTSAAACSQLGVPRCRMLIRKAVKTPGSSLPKTSWLTATT